VPIRINWEKILLQVLSLILILCLFALASIALCFVSCVLSPVFSVVFNKRFDFQAFLKRSGVGITMSKLPKAEKVDVSSKIQR